MGHCRCLRVFRLRGVLKRRRLVTSLPASADGDMDEASRTVARTLAGSIRNGGFPPDWTERQAAAFRDSAPPIAPMLIQYFTVKLADE